MSSVTSLAPLPGGTPLTGAVGVSSTSPAIVVGGSSGTNSITLALGNIGGVKTMNSQNGDLNMIMADGMGFVESTGGNLLLHPYYPITGTATTATVVAGNLANALAWDSASAYVPGAMVISGGSTYVCLVAQPASSPAPPNAGAWQSVGGGSGGSSISNAGGSVSIDATGVITSSTDVDTNIVGTGTTSVIQMTAPTFGITASDHIAMSGGTVDNGSLTIGDNDGNPPTTGLYVGATKLLFNNVNITNGGGNWSYRSVWQPAQSYVVNDVVFDTVNTAQTYICIEPNTSVSTPPSADSGQWKLFATNSASGVAYPVTVPNSAGGNQNQWQSGSAYAVGSVVYSPTAPYNWFICYVEVPTGNTTDPQADIDAGAYGQGTYWQLLAPAGFTTTSGTTPGTYYGPLTLTGDGITSTDLTTGVVTISGASGGTPTSIANGTAPTNGSVAVDGTGNIVATTTGDIGIGSTGTGTLTLDTDVDTFIKIFSTGEINIKADDPAGTKNDIVITTNNSTTGTCDLTIGTDTDGTLSLTGGVTTSIKGGTTDAGVINVGSSGTPPADGLYVGATSVLFNGAPLGGAGGTSISQGGATVACTGTGDIEMTSPSLSVWSINHTSGDINASATGANILNGGIGATPGLVTVGGTSTTTGLYVANTGMTFNGAPVGTVTGLAVNGVANPTTASVINLIPGTGTTITNDGTSVTISASTTGSGAYLTANTAGTPTTNEYSSTATYATTQALVSYNGGLYASVAGPITNIAPYGMGTSTAFWTGVAPSLCVSTAGTLTPVAVLPHPSSATVPYSYILQPTVGITIVDGSSGVVNVGVSGVVGTGITVPLPTPATIPPSTNNWGFTSGNGSVAITSSGPGNIDFTVSSPAITFKGVFNGTTTYFKDDVVIFGGSSWLVTANSVATTTPYDAPTSYQNLGVIPCGQSGVSPGDMTASLPTQIVTSPYSDTTAYQIGQIVSGKDGFGYVSVVNSQTGVPPSLTTSSWAPIATNPLNTYMFQQTGVNAPGSVVSGGYTLGANPYPAMNFKQPPNQLYGGGVTTFTGGCYFNLLGGDTKSGNASWIGLQLFDTASTTTASNSANSISAPVYFQTPISILGGDGLTTYSSPVITCSITTDYGTPTASTLPDNYVLGMIFAVGSSVQIISPSWFVTGKVTTAYGSGPVDTLV